MQPSVKLGAGLALGEDERTPDDIRPSLGRLLDHREYRDRAGELADEIAALPPVDHAAELIERLARSADRTGAPCSLANRPERQLGHANRHQRMRSRPDRDPALLLGPISA